MPSDVRCGQSRPCPTTPRPRRLSAIYDRIQAFGSRLATKPLHLATLAAMELETRASTHLVFEVAELLGRSECADASADEETLLRLLTPVCKVAAGGASRSTSRDACDAEGALHVWIGRCSSTSPSMPSG